MRRPFLHSAMAAMAVLFCLIVGGGSATSTPDVAKKDQPASFAIAQIKKGDRLPILATSKADAKATPSGAMRAAAKRPPLGCDPLFSPIADPAQARLYKRCSA